MAGVRELLVIAATQDKLQFQCLFWDAPELGLELSYAVHPRPRGLTQAFLVGADFHGYESVALGLWGSSFYGTGLGRSLRLNNDVRGGRIYAYRAGVYVDWAEEIISAAHAGPRSSA
jgi:glucose-1-phosphate thymidylyltransferase